MKICVLVKEVPDAAVEKRMDPGSKRLDRSGEKNLNPFDTHAIEAAMQIREGGAVGGRRDRRRDHGPARAPFRALHKAVSLGADRSVHLTDDALAGLGRVPPPATRSRRCSRPSRPTSCCSASSRTTASATRSARSWPTT